MFRGRYEHAIDGKGRTSLPSRFREVLSGQAESRLILTTGLDTCIVAYPVREWTAFEEKLMSMSQFDRGLKNLRRIYFSSAVECDVDNVGRLLIPQTLRNHADLRREVLWSGMGTHLELWDKDRYAAMREKILNDEPTREEMERRAAEMGL